MPQISTLVPQVLNGLLRQKPFPQNLLGRGLLGAARGYPFPTWSYDIVRGGQTMSKPNTRNSEAHIQGGRSIRTVSGAFMYMRDKRMFSATTLYYLREPGEQFRQQAEKAVLEEVNELDNTQERFIEWMFWKAVLEGSLSVQRYDTARVDVNYYFPSDHLGVIPSPLWSSTSTADVLTNLGTWKQKIITDSGFVPNRIIMNSTTFQQYVLKNAAIAALYSDAMKEEYLRTLTVKGLAGFDWTFYDNEYVDDWTTPGTETSYKYIPTGKLIMYADSTKPWELLEGLSADHEALQLSPNYTGKFAKSWIEKDPSNRVHLQEWSPMITILRPDNILVADVD